MKPSVAVFFGGTSGSRDLSRETGYWMCQYIPRSKYRVLPVHVTDRGDWQVPTGALPATGPVDKMMDNLWQAVPAVSPQQGMQKLFNQPVNGMMTAVRGLGGDDGSLHNIGALTGIPVVGPSPQACIKTANKEMYPYLAKNVMGTPRMKHYVKSMPVDSIIQDAQENFVPPFFVKPANEEGSIGVERVSSGDEALAAVKRNAENGDVLLQEELPGDEVSVTMMDDAQGNVQVLPVSQIVPINTSFYDAMAKRRGGRVALSTANWREDAMAKRAAESARDLYDELGLTGLVSIDMKMNGDKANLLEVNTVPTLTEYSLLKHQLQTAKLHPTLLLQRLLERYLNVDSRVPLVSGGPTSGVATF